MDARARDERERLAELAQLVVREPNSIPHRLDLAMALLNVGRRDEAIGLFRDIALSYADGGQLVQAMAVCRGILEIDPAHEETLSLLSKLVERRGGRAASRLMAEDSDDATVDAGDEEPADQAFDGGEGERTPVEALPEGWQAAPRVATPIDDGPSADAEDQHTPADPLDDHIATPAELTALPADESEDRDAASDEDDGEPTNPGERPKHLATEPQLQTLDPNGDPVAAALAVSAKQGQTISTLPAFPLLSDLPRLAFMELLREVRVLERTPGQTILSEGGNGDAFYLIADGSVRVKKGNVEVALLGPGAFFGEFAVLSDQRRHATVEAVSAVRLLEVDKTLLDRLVAEHPGVARILRAFYSDRLLATLLQTAPFFAQLQPEERAEVSTRFRPRRFGRGATIIEEGAAGGGLYLILVGEVEVVRSDAAGDVTLGKLNEGSYFGEMSLLKGANASATVRATRLCELVQLPPRDFYEIVSRHPILWEQLRDEAQRREPANVAILAGEAHGDDKNMYLV